MAFLLIFIKIIEILQMKIKSNFFLFCFVFLSFKSLWAQQQTDINYETFLNAIISSHPVSIKSNNIGRYGELQFKAAKGVYDPVLSANFDNKYFNSVNYYSYANAEIKQPLFTSQYIKAGYDFSNGSFVNPEHKTNQYGLPYIGFEVALLQGLIIDKRRSELLKSRHYKEYYNAEKLILINNLLFESSQVYFDYLFFDKQYVLNNFFVDLAKQRISLIESLASIGEKPALDTVESKILLQSRLFELQSAFMEKNKKLMELNSCLWQNGFPDSVFNKVFVDSLDLYFIKSKQLISNNINNAEQVNPLLQQYKAKQNILEVDKKLKWEMIKPKLDLNYNLLSNNYATVNPVFSNNNYKWGANLSFPLFLRNSRNEYKMSDLSAKNNFLELNSKSNELKYKQLGLFQAIEVLSNQIENAQNMVQLSKQLFEAEKLRFSNGESSLFLLNTRESKWLEFELKLLEYKTKYIKTTLNIAYLNGGLISSNWLN